MEQTKQCTNCKRVLPLTEFYKNKGMKDGHLSRCRLCHMRSVRTARAKNPDHYRLKDTLRKRRQRAKAKRKPV